MGKMLSRRQMQHLCICLALGLLLCSLWQAGGLGPHPAAHRRCGMCRYPAAAHPRCQRCRGRPERQLRVRDAVLACLDAACPAGNQTDARSWAARNLFTLQLAARHALARCGVDAPVQVQLVNMYFPARQYTGGCLPAGRYDAVRITIGSGSGQNWWCVLYPGLCRAACGGYALPEENDLVCGDYILRLRFVDWWNRHTASRTTRVLAGDAALPCRIAWRERSV